MTETEIKAMKGIYEQDSHIWQRKYKFDEWQETFRYRELLTIECYRLIECWLTDAGTYDFIVSCLPPPNQAFPYELDFRKTCTADAKDWYAKLEDIGYWNLRYEMMLEDIIYYFHIQLVNYAHIDKYDYPGLIGTEFETPEIRA